LAPPFGKLGARKVITDDKSVWSVDAHKIGAETPIAVSPGRYPNRVIHAAGSDVAQ
jgi:hypothetical protein